MKKALVITVSVLLFLLIVVILFLPTPSHPNWKNNEPGSTVLIVELDAGGAPLPFLVEVMHDPDAEDRNTRWMAGVQEPGGATVFYPQGRKVPDRIEIPFGHYDSKLELEGIFKIPAMKGSWVKNRGSGELARLEAWVIRDREGGGLFKPELGAGNQPEFEGRWSVEFESSDDLAIGEFEVDENQIASGTFMTTTGDYRFLAGRVDGNLMRLSTFDGAHAFLFHARMQDDGTIEGDFWSGNWWHETWTATRDENATLPDAFEQTVIADDDALDDMVFKNLEGEPTRVLDVLDESNAPARIIEIFGTWCPNCSDAGRELVSLREQYGDNLAVVGLAFEITEDFERSVQQVTRHHEHIGTDWPILIAGLSDKAKASAALPVLDKVRSYPTLIFLDRNNEVQGVYSGFSGPATGDAYTQQRERFEELIESMIE